MNECSLGLLASHHMYTQKHTKWIKWSANGRNYKFFLNLKRLSKIVRVKWCLAWLDKEQIYFKYFIYYYYRLNGNALLNSFWRLERQLRLYSIRTISWRVFFFASVLCIVICRIVQANRLKNKIRQPTDTAIQIIILWI